MSKPNPILVSAYMLTQVMVLCIGVWFSIVANWPVAIGFGLLYAIMMAVSSKYKLEDHT